MVLKNKLNISNQIELNKAEEKISKEKAVKFFDSGKIEKLKVADISKTQGCPLARVMRRELKKRNITGVKVVYSEESVELGDVDKTQSENTKKIAPPSMIFVPAVAGLYIAREVVMDLIKDKEN